MGNLQVETIVADRLNPARIFAGSVAGLFISTDGGDNWQAAGLTQVGVSDLEIDADNRDTFYAVDRFKAGIYSTSDGGENWEEIGQEISDLVTEFSVGLTAHPKIGGLLYAVSEVGTFKSRDMGQTWEPAGLGLPSDGIREVSFSPAEPATLFAGTALGVFRLDPQELYFPLLQGSSADFTAIAVTNDLVGPTLIELEVRDSLGEIRQYPENPFDLRLETGKQVARLGAEFFGLGLEDERSGWVRLRAGWAELGSFFQFGSLDNPTVTRLDGSVAIREKSNTLYFNRIYDGPGTFPGLNGELDAETVLAVANPNQESILVSFSYFDGGGTLRFTEERRLPALGCIRARVTQIFRRPSRKEGFVKVAASGAGAVGFALIQVGDTLIGLNAATRTARELFSAQAAHGFAGSRIATEVKVLNTLDEFRGIKFEMIGADGSILAGPVTFGSSPMDSSEYDIGELFQLGSIDDPAVVGSLRVSSDDQRGGLIADVIFGDPDQARYAAALPLEDQLAIRGTFSQVANLNTGPLAAQTFTGLAFFNPGSEEVEIQITVLTFDCLEVGSATIRLGAGARFSDVLSNLIPDSAGQVGGSVVFESTGGVVAQQLFGNPLLDFLSAVPASVFETASP